MQAQLTFGEYMRRLAPVPQVESHSTRGHVPSSGVRVRHRVDVV